MSVRVVILGAGFGGLELSARLCRELPGEVTVTLIDQSDAFIFGFSKLDVMFGRRTMDEVRQPYRRLSMPDWSSGKSACSPSTLSASGWSPT